MRSVAVFVGISVAVVAAPLPSFAAHPVPTRAATGSVKVHLVDPSNTPAPGQKFCATTKKANPSKPDRPNKVLGKCGTTNKHGNATLTKVPVGQHFVTYFTSDSVPYLSKKVTVKKNKTIVGHWKLDG